MRNHPAIQALFTTGKIPAMYIDSFPHGELIETNELGTVIDFESAGIYVGWVTAVLGMCSNELVLVKNAVSDRLRINRLGNGCYQVSCIVSFSGGAAIEVEVAIFKNGVEIGDLHCDRKTGIAMCTGFIELEGHPIYDDLSDYIDVRFKSNTASSSITLDHCRLLALRV